jgi:hypothetical protein
MGLPVPGVTARDISSNSPTIPPHISAPLRGYRGHLGLGEVRVLQKASGNMKLFAIVLALSTLVTGAVGQICGDRLIFRRQCMSDTVAEPPLISLGSMSTKAICQAACEGEIASNPTLPDTTCCQYLKVRVCVCVCALPTPRGLFLAELDPSTLDGRVLLHSPLLIIPCAIPPLPCGGSAG